MTTWIASFLAWVARLISGATAAWIDCPPSARQRIYFGNHSSHLDFVVMWSVLPERVRPRVRPVAAAEYWNRSALRRYVAGKVFRAVLVERASADLAGRQQQMQKMLDGLGQDESLIFFPEGTRGSGDEVQPFKSGLYHLALSRPNLELVPVYLENLNRVLPKGEFLPVPLLSRVFFGPPIHLNDGEPKADFLERARQALLRLSGHE